MIEISALRVLSSDQISRDRAAVSGWERCSPCPSLVRAVLLHAGWEDCIYTVNMRMMFAALMAFASLLRQTACVGLLAIAPTAITSAGSTTHRITTAGGPEARL